jgi:hypothetical protein
MMQAISGGAGSASRHFDLISSINLCGSIGITADFSVAAAFCVEALSKAVKGTNSQQ